MSISPVDLSDLSDPRLAPYVNVRFTNTTRFSEHFIAEGRLVVERLIASDYEVQSLLVEKGRMPQWVDRLSTSTSVYTLPRVQLEQLVGFDFHRGVMACGLRREIPSADEIKWSTVRLAMALISVTEQENVGSLLRSAAAFGVDHVLLGPGTADPFARRVLRVSMATALKHKYFRLPHPVESLRIWRQFGAVRTIATTLDSNAVCMSDLQHDDRPQVLMIGNEAKGLSREILDVATDWVTIPMRLGTDSLNVAIAGALFLYELSNWQPVSGRQPQ